MSEPKYKIGDIVEFNGDIIRIIRLTRPTNMAPACYCFTALTKKYRKTYNFEICAYMDKNSVLASEAAQVLYKVDK